jgi:hypothetical protein
MPPRRLWTISVANQLTAPEKMRLLRQILRLGRRRGIRVQRRQGCKPVRARVVLTRAKGRKLFDALAFATLQATRPAALSAPPGQLRLSSAPRRGRPRAVWKRALMFQVWKGLREAGLRHGFTYPGESLLTLTYRVCASVAGTPQRGDLRALWQSFWDSKRRIPRMWYQRRARLIVI